MRNNLRKHKGKALAKGKFSPAAKTPLTYMAKGGRIQSLKELDDLADKLELMVGRNRSKMGKREDLNNDRS